MLTFLSDVVGLIRVVTWHFALDSLLKQNLPVGLLVLRRRRRLTKRMMLRNQKKMEKMKKKEKRKMNKSPDPLIDLGQANQVILAAFQECLQGCLF